MIFIEVERYADNRWMVKADKNSQYDKYRCRYLYIDLVNWLGFLTISDFSIILIKNLFNYLSNFHIVIGKLYAQSQGQTRSI